jgi:hypothetical protein
VKNIEQEKRRILALISIFVDEILEKIDLSKDTFKIEERLLDNRNSIDAGHLAANRI